MITQQMLISDILAVHPSAVEVFERYGLACGQCVAAGMESLSSVADVHDVDLRLIIDDLNSLIASEDSSSEGE